MANLGIDRVMSQIAQRKADFGGRKLNRIAP